jgi:hypothetical protein
MAALVYPLGGFARGDSEKHSIRFGKPATLPTSLFPSIVGSKRDQPFASAAVAPLQALIRPADVVSPSWALGPSTSRITVARSRRACAPLP